MVDTIAQVTPAMIKSKARNGAAEGTLIPAWRQNLWIIHISETSRGETTHAPILKDVDN